MKESISSNIRKEINNSADIDSATLDNKDFLRLSEFITREFGIKIPAVKKPMLQSRLQKRLKDLGYNNFTDYVNYLFSEQGLEEEVIHMIDIVSTNKTDFFRENSHFDYLLHTVLPDCYPAGTKASLKVWSAGCSSGEEAYTLAIVLSEYKEKNPLIDFSVFATDISARMLRTANAAIYREDRTDNIPMGLKMKYFLRSKNREEKKIRIIPELREKVIFSRLNLADDCHSTPFVFDIVFCRNVLIYFDRKVQEKIILKLCSNIRKDGYLFLGHSESIAGLNLPLRHVIPTVYIKI
jgi:chemotaxis protein methyltransferase CheR